MYKIPQKKCKLRSDLQQLHKEPKYLAWLHEVKQPECFACGKTNGIELHHIKEASSDKKDDRLVIPLCGVECHRLGSVLSAHGTPKKFRDTFPLDMQKEYAMALYEEYLSDNS